MWSRWVLAGVGATAIAVGSMGGSAEARSWDVGRPARGSPGWKFLPPVFFPLAMAFYRIIARHAGVTRGR